MDKYIILCTEEQTRKAYELGAPLNFDYHSDDFQNTIKISNKLYAEIPTAEEIIGWLDEQGLRISIYGHSSYISQLFDNSIEKYFKVSDSRKEAILAAISAALNYLKDIK